MENSGKMAQAIFQEGYNCAQAVFLTFSEALGLPKDLAARMANGFGGGLAGSGGLCGALSGACLAISAKYGRDEPSREGLALQRQQTTYAQIRGLLADFADEFGGVNCPELLERGCAASGEAKNEKYLCAAYVRRAAELAGERLMDERQDEKGRNRKI